MADEVVQMSLRIPTDLHERLVGAAEERLVSVNWLAAKAISDFIDRLIPVDELRLTREREDT